MPLGCLAALFGLREAPAPPPPAHPPGARASGARASDRPQTPLPRSPLPQSPLPQSLPVRAKRYFFSADENAFFQALEDALSGTSYRAFPNVRLNDLFTITDAKKRSSVLGRLRDKHTDFVIVDASDHFRPLLAIELDGESHQQDAQKYRDAVKDVIFRSGGLPLLRLPSRRYRVAEIRAALRELGLRV